MSKPDTKTDAAMAGATKAGAKPAFDWDPSLPEHQADPIAIHRQLRAQCPVAHSTQWGGFWTLSKYEDIRAVGIDKDHYTASVRTIVPSSPRAGLPRLPLQADQPMLGIYRKALSHYFSDPYTLRLEPDIRQLAIDLLNPLIGKSVIFYLEKPQSTTRSGAAKQMSNA